MKWTQCLEIVSFYLAIQLLVIASSGTPVQLADTADNLPAGGYSDDDLNSSINDISDRTADVLVQNWRGFATKDDKSHPVRLNVETISTVNPDEARRLLALNISLEEVRSQVRAGDRNVIRKGNIRLNNDIYQLIDIVIKPSGNRSILEANVASPRSGSDPEDETTTVGHTVLTVSIVDNTEVAEGYMVIDDSKYNGTYNLSLKEHPGRGPRAGLQGRR